MALTKTIYSLMQLRLKFAEDSNFKDVYSRFVELTTTGNEVDIQSYRHNTVATDKNLLPSSLDTTKLKAIFVLFRAVDTTNNDAPISITMKVNGSTELNMQHLFMHKGDVVGDYLDITSLTFSQVATTDTEVLVIALGDN